MILSRRINEAAHSLQEVHLTFRKLLVVIPLIQFRTECVWFLVSCRTYFCDVVYVSPFSLTDQETNEDLHRNTFRYPNCLCFVNNKGN